MKHYVLVLFMSISCYAHAQQSNDSIATKNLKEVIVSSTRIDLPLSENARSIQIISKENIRKAG